MSRYRGSIGPAGMGGLTALRGASSPIVSIQRNTITINGATSATRTITAVDLANTVIRHLGWTGAGASAASRDIVARLELTNATTVTVYLNTAVAADRIVGFEVIEYRPGVLKSVQRGTITSAAASATAALIEVNTAKACVDNLGHTTTFATAEADSLGVRVELTNGTTVTEYNPASISVTVGYQAVEWF